MVVGGMFAMFFFASLYLQNILGYSALTTGLAFLPVTVGITMGAVTAQQLVPKNGVKPVLITGLIVGAAGLTILGVSTQVDGTYLGVLGGLFPMSVGLGATFVSLTLVATTNVDENDAGLASLANDRTNSVLGDVLGRPAQEQVQNGLVEGYQLAFFVAAGLLALGAVLLGVLLRQRDVARIDAGDAVPVPA
jgi:hypothetical protein